MATVERAVGVLEDDLQSAEIRVCPLLEPRGKLAAFELHGARGRRDDPEQRPRQRCLARAGLTDEAERLAGPDRRRDAGERVNFMASLDEDLAEIVEPHERCLLPVDGRHQELRGLLAWQPGSQVLVEAPCDVAGGGLRDGRLLAEATIVCQGAAIGEHAAFEPRAETRQEPRDRVEPAVVLPDAAAGYAAQQADRVRMARILQHGADGALLHQAAGVEDAHAVAHLRDHTEVVADEQHRRMELRLQRRDEIEDISLDRGIESCSGLVEDQQGRILREGHRDHDPLLHAARELVRVAAHHARWICNLHSFESRPGAVGRLAARYTEDRERLRNLRADAHPRVQRGAGVLVHHRDGPRVVLTELARAEPEDVLPRDRHGPTRDAPVAGQVAHDCQRGGGLPASGLADETIRPSTLDRERHAAQDRPVDAADSVDQLEVRDVERQRRWLAHRSYTSRMPSATRLTATTSVAIAIAGKNVIHQYGSISV